MIQYFINLLARSTKNEQNLNFSNVHRGGCKGAVAPPDRFMPKAFCQPKLGDIKKSQNL
jgi:hypothetical protein